MKYIIEISDDDVDSNFDPVTEFQGADMEDARRRPELFIDCVSWVVTSVTRADA